jgi:23S rRNA U2552 (ribose-2'-O)-methylase RlmE/FtsJ
MTYFLLPKLSNKLNINNLELTFINNETELYLISKSLKEYLNLMKKKIDNICLDWDICKKNTNPYEYIHTIISNSQKISISKIKPLSRSFYKMIEIAQTFSLFENSENIKTFHLAEGPGGFIEAFVFLRKNKKDTYYGMTLISDDINIPSWKKSKLFLQKNNNIIIESGKDNTGNLMNKDNLIYCLEKYNNTMDIITGDGGFDFSLDFNKQEEISINLIFAQICFALAMQKINGTFILKVFDLFTFASIDLLYILSLSYEKVYIMKPNTSRFANSEKYIICKNFRLNNSKEIVEKLSNFFPYLNNKDYIKRFLNIDISYLYKNKIEEINAIFGQQQIENITTTFNLIENINIDKLELYKKNNINKCINWCQKYNIPCNKHLYIQNNIQNNIENIIENDFEIDASNNENVLSIE